MQRRRDIAARHVPRNCPRDEHAHALFQPSYVRGRPCPRSLSRGYVACCCRYLNGWYNASSDCFKVLKASTGAICYSLNSSRTALPFWGQTDSNSK